MDREEIILSALLRSGRYAGDTIAADAFGQVDGGDRQQYSLLPPDVSLALPTPPSGKRVFEPISCRPGLQEAFALLGNIGFEVSFS